jgi:hypothetical protein
MSKIKSRVAALATIILTLGFAATGVVPALAHTQMSPRATVHRHVAYQLGYANPTGQNPQFVNGRGIDGASCDLPSSGCSNDERITN